MRIRRLAGAAALTAAAVSMVAAPGASAETGDYGASSSGSALSLSLFGQELTIGQASAEVNSDPSANAAGAGIANPLSPVGVTEAAAAAESDDVATGQNCEGELPEIPGLVLAVACSSSNAAVAGGVPTASATAGIVEPLSVNVVGPLLDTPLGDVLGQTQEALDTALEELCVLLCPIDDAVPELGLQDTLGDLLDALFEGADLAIVTVGTTAVESTAISTECTANGARIDVLDLPPIVGGIDPPPVLSVIVGEAATSVTVDDESGEGTPTVNPSLVTVIVPSIPALAEGLALEIGQTIEIPLPEPLGTSRIVAADGETGTNDEGQTFAQASAVSIELLPGLQGGIALSLADCASVAGAEVVTPAAPTTTTPTTEPPRLPRTGGTGSDGWAPAATIGLAALGLVLLRRSRAEV